jgi:antitoxin (DNA-binding transcriptional repressor) of toxin-antitoxin stability system
MSPDPSLTPSFSVIDVSIMKNRTATVADLRNHFRRVSAWLENGESVEIIKRGRRFARLIPASAEATPNKPVKIDFARQLRSVWGKKVFSDAEVQAMRDAELGSES